MNAEEVTIKHIRLVKELLLLFSNRLDERGDKHDESKFDDDEMIPLQKMQDVVDREGHAKYGSDEYAKRLKILEPMLAHHYANNSHHPEHFDNGVDGMDLLDIVEMFMDWKAASERGNESSMNITSACERFDISPQLENIFKNTAKTFKFKAS